MACLRLKFVFPKDSPYQLSHRFHGTRIRITRSNLKDVLWSADGFKSILSDTTPSDGGELFLIGGEKQAESPKALVSHNNKQISKVKVNIEDFVISIGTHSIPEIAAIKVSLDITADTWVGKSHCSGSLGIQGVSVSDIHALDPCIILGNDLITASWRCSFTSTHVYKRCLIMNAESNEILSVILRPDCLSVLANLQQDYSSFTQNTGPSSLTRFGENVKLIIKEHCPRTQVSSTLEGVNVSLEMDVFEQLSACTLEDIRVQCTQDTENFSCDFTVKDIEVEDRINNTLSVSKLSKDGIHKRSLHATIIQEASSERRSVSFQQLYGEIIDLNISLEEEFLLKLLVFFGITEMKQLWGEEKSESTKPTPTQSLSSGSQSPHEEEVSFFFERLEANDVGIVISVSPNQDLPEDLLKLKEQLGVPNGLPPCVENARLDFERFLRTGIYYRSFDGLVRDIKRHYLKEIGRQSAKILGSLHLLGNVTGLKDNIAEGLTELKESGDYMGFARHVRSGLTDSYYKLTDSWSAYVRPSPRKSLPEPVVEKPIEQQTQEDNVDAGLFYGITSGLGGWIFCPLEETIDLLQEEVPSTESVAAEIQSPLSSSTPERDARSTQMRDVPRDADSTISTSQRDERTDRHVSFTTQQNDAQSKRDLSDDVDYISQRDEQTVTQPLISPQHNAQSDVNQLNDTSQHDVTNYVDVHDVARDFSSVVEDDTQSTWASMSSFSTPTGWELMPREIQKRLKGQEFLRRLKRGINNDEDVDEKFLCCLKLRYMDPSDKLNALLTTCKVYFMKVGSPSRDNVILEVNLNRLYKTQEKNHDGMDYLELIMRINGMQRLCLPSPNAKDNPLVRCDSLHLAAKAANKINKARKRYSSNDSCPCKVILNTVL
ncbi:uncharacterized protein LOC116301181 [Actinia tenebrosa]|uniref:Uncharacterized protein LOC116301181 n=1 Tax=Actinia tenebrosa TaxID=6105 RepID=A0A6P8IH62_ACTTE|nr:uncharacterized protein LOC116301181 [Actinia tenebrosa]